VRPPRCRRYLSLAFGTGRGSSLAAGRVRRSASDALRWRDARMSVCERRPNVEGVTWALPRELKLSADRAISLPSFSPVGGRAPSTESLPPPLRAGFAAAGTISRPGSFSLVVKGGPLSPAEPPPYRPSRLSRPPAARVRPLRAAPKVPCGEGAWVWLRYTGGSSPPPPATRA